MVNLGSVCVCLVTIINGVFGSLKSQHVCYLVTAQKACWSIQGVI